MDNFLHLIVSNVHLEAPGENNGATLIPLDGRKLEKKPGMPVNVPQRSSNAGVELVLYAQAGPMTTHGGVTRIVDEIGVSKKMCQRDSQEGLGFSPGRVSAHRNDLYLIDHNPCTARDELSSAS